MFSSIFVSGWFITYFAGVYSPWTRFQVVVKILIQVQHAFRTSKGTARYYSIWILSFTRIQFCSLCSNNAVWVRAFHQSKQLQHLTSMYQQLSKCFSKDLIFCPLFEKVQSPYLQDKIQCFDTLTSLYRLSNPFGSLFSLRMQSLLIQLFIWERIFSSWLNIFTTPLGLILRNKWRGPSTWKEAFIVNTEQDANWPDRH